MKKSLLLKFFSLFLVSTITVFAQNQENEEILFSVTVMAKTGDFIKGLKAENFKIYDEKKLQPMTYFREDKASISVGILVDTSESMENFRITEIPQALANFVNKSHSDNEYFLMTFNSTQGLISSDFQGNQGVLKSIENLSATVSSIGKTNANTNLYDALNSGIEKVSKGKYAKKILIVLSDWFDNESKNDFRDIQKLVKKSNVLFYNIGILDGRDTGTQEGMLAQANSDEIAELSGGKSYYPGNNKELHEIISVIAKEVQNQYLIGFKMSEKEQKEKWRKIEVKVELPTNLGNLGKVNVRSRKGYYLSAKGS